MKAGRLSYTRDEAGERRIEVAELERVFGIKAPETGGFNRGNGASLASDAQALACNDTHVPESERVIAAQRETIAQQDATNSRLARKARPRGRGAPRPDRDPDRSAAPAVVATVVPVTTKAANCSLL
jgi:hypothetical protein